MRYLIRHNTRVATHDPSGYPLPEVSLPWPVAFALAPVGLMLIIVGAVLLTLHLDNFNASSFYAMIGVGAAIILVSCGLARYLYVRGGRKDAEWEAANPEAARAFEARGGWAGVPRMVLPGTNLQAPAVTAVWKEAGATIVTALTNYDGYFHKPEFRGLRLMPEQMASGPFSSTTTGGAATMMQSMMPMAHQQQPLMDAGGTTGTYYGTAKSL